jgi:glycosyltransferase involved in cell wall biosynthesis
MIRISVIIPSFNQGQFIEETLRSVIDQNYPALELLVIDGGSTDGTVEILRKYSDRITFWESTPDRGQSHAINKGLARATGDVWSYLNSDDLLCEGALGRVADCFADPSIDWLAAVSSTFDEVGDRGEVRPHPTKSIREVLTPWNRTVEYVFPCSNVCFMRRSVYERIGGFDESYHYSMDMELYTRARFAGYLMHTIPDVLGRWRWHAESKTLREGRAYRFLEEELRIAETFADRLPQGDRCQLLRDVAEQSRWFLVRRALHENPNGPRWRKLCRLLSDAISTPSLLTFRPWLGAVKKQVL